MPALTARMRWLIGGGVAVVAIAVAIGAALILSARPVPEALKYLPGDSAVVGELRLDLPGDQFQKVGNLLAHFPGFADQSTLGAKIDETLDRLAKGATNGSVDYTTKLKPWLAGPTFVGVIAGGGAGAGASPAAPSASPGPGGTAFGSAADGVIVATTDGTVGCDKAIPDGTNRAIPEGQLLVAPGGQMACFMDGKFGLLGTPSGIQAALAAHKAGTGMDRDARYAKARDTLGLDRLATVYVSGAVARLMQSAEASLPPSLPIALPTAAAVPDWLIAGIRAEDDALVTDVFVAPPTNAGASAGATAAGSPLPTLPPPHASDIAGFLPGNTALLAEAHGVGIGAQAAIEALRSDPQFQAQAAQLGAALGAAGGAQGLVGWISDLGVVVIPQATPAAAAGNPGVDVGVVLVATDEATASTKATQLKSLLSLAALGQGGTVNEETVDGTTVTTIDLGNLSNLLNQAGAGQIGGISLPADLHVTLTLAVRGKLVLIGGDDGFARDVLGVDAGATLADQPAYQRSMARASASNLGQLYLAGGSLRDLADRLVPPDQQARWQNDIKPYAAPIDAVLVTTTLENGLSHTKLVVAVSTPPPTPAASATP